MDRDASYSNIDEYIAQFPPEVQERLGIMRETIRKAAPRATEKISYGIPTFYLNGNLVHFAGYKNHVGFYPGADGIASFKERLSEYNLSKGTVQFPNDKPLPLELVDEITRFRVAQNEALPQKKSYGKK